MNKSRRRLADVLADHLAADIAANDYPLLPPLQELSVNYHASKPTMVAATKILRERGILDFHPGQRMRIVGRSSGELASSMDTLYKEIKTQVLDGTYRIGDSLPKVGFVAADRGASNHTVLAAYQRLIDEHLVHRKGRSWIIGRPASVSECIPRNPPVVLLVQHREHSWGGLGKADRTEKFCKSFELEAEQRHIQLMPVLASEADFHHGYMAAAGLRQVKELIRRLGNQYTGALIVNDRAELTDFVPSIRALTSMHKPVVWFDTHDEDRPPHADRSFFTRCYISAGRAESLAVDLLAQTRHRHVAFADFNNQDWALQRFSRLEAYGASLDPPVRVATTVGLFKLIESSTDEYLRSLIRLADRPSIPIHRVYNLMSDTFADSPPELAEMGIDAAWEERHGKFVGLLRLLAKLGNIGKDDLLKKKYGVPEYENGIFFQIHLILHVLLKSKATAIIAPNDSNARYVYVCVDALGLRVPEHVSLVSFDNYWLLHHLPVTTIDFGLGHLGYTAFHAILRDIPVLRDKDGNIASKPRVVHRGSIAGAGRPVIDLLRA